jgi:hypothetical protein
MPLGEVSSAKTGEVGRGRIARRRGEEGPVLTVGEEERGAVAAILRRAARASYLEIEELQLESRPGEISVRARVYEPEEDYE